MEKKQISETIRTAQKEEGGKTRFYAWLKMPHMKKSRFVVSTLSEDDAIKQAKDFEEYETKRKADRKTAQASKRQARAEKDREAEGAANVYSGMAARLDQVARQAADFATLVSLRAPPTGLPPLTQPA